MKWLWKQDEGTVNDGMSELDADPKENESIWTSLAEQVWVYQEEIQESQLCWEAGYEA